MVPKSNFQGLRCLSEEEMLLVAGGTNEVTVVGVRQHADGNGGGGWSFSTASGAGILFGSVQGALYELATQDSDNDGIVDLLDEDSREVVVEATPAQISAAQAHHDTAFNRVVIIGSIAAAGLSQVQWTGWMGMAAAGAGFASGELDLVDHVVDALADANYWEDYYEDGKWDGFLQPHNQDGDQRDPYTPRHEQ